MPGTPAMCIVVMVYGLVTVIGVVTVIVYVK